MSSLENLSKPRTDYYQFIHDDRLQEAPTVGAITRSIEPATTEMLCYEVFERFLADTHLYAIPVVDVTKQPQFIIERAAFIEFFAKPYTHEIFGRRSISFLFNSPEYENPHQAIIVEDSSSIEDVVQIIIDAGMQHMVTGLLVTHFGAYKGVANGHDLLSLITQRKQAELFYLAHYDHLTGAPNRTLMSDRLRQACLDADRYGYAVGVLFIDVDRFKIINDSLGHSLGDAVLRILAERFKSAARATDTVSRLGGDEFVILMEKLNDAADADVVARRVLDAMKVPLDVLGHSITVTVSIGVAIYPNDDTEISRLLAKADAAMYAAKTAGRNDYRIYAEGKALADPSLLHLANDLRQAIERGELVLHFQPQVQMTTQKVCGVEALVRWNHPVRGMVSPAEFIPLAEESGLICQLGEWVLREACQQLGKWAALGLAPIRMSVNVSALQFHQKDFLPLLRRVFAETQVDPNSIELELTEGVLIQNVEDSLRTLKAIRALGVSLAIDDFGTGFSSLNYLRLFPINRLKIDQSFIRDIEQTPANESITRTIIALAESLSLEIVAEGIETKAEQSILENLGCPEGQGYLFAKPLPASDLVEWLRSRDYQ